MEILVFSDSHGRAVDMYGLIETEAPDAVIHLGDYYADARDLQRSYPNLPIYCVRGNNDLEPEAPLFAVITPGGLRIFLTHGHRERVRRMNPGVVAARAAEAHCTLALYGHTHLRNDITAQGVRVMNPGSISLPRDSTRSCLRLSVQNGALVKAQFLDSEGLPLTNTNK